ncbi:MAG: hypothetical protein KAI47_21895 [Deltaproteobacteria bacterium]|nr:hypothetical protein [Deltaproteobacteria bacterium]
MEPTVFGQILARMLSEIPVSRGVIFADDEGEIIDQASQSDATEMAFFGAHWGIVFRQTRTRFQNLAIDEPEMMILGFERERVILCGIEGGYYIALALPPDGNIGHAARLLRQTRKAIVEQM